ncbi:MAG: hypothetical protein JWQ95_5412 [Sphaerisporangium sp.]|jgi:hypothetical protein|nr:hypothetical protein [Sphaerisporangium sp.]
MLPPNAETGGPSIFGAVDQVPGCEGSTETRKQLIATWLGQMKAIGLR